MLYAKKTLVFIQYFKCFNIGWVTFCYLYLNLYLSFIKKKDKNNDKVNKNVNVNNCF